MNRACPFGPHRYTVGFSGLEDFPQILLLLKLRLNAYLLYNGKLLKNNYKWQTYCFFSANLRQNTNA